MIRRRCTFKLIKLRTNSRKCSRTRLQCIWRWVFYQRQAVRRATDLCLVEFRFNRIIQVFLMVAKPLLQPTSKSYPYHQHQQMNLLASQLPTSASHGHHKTKANAHKSNTSPYSLQLYHLVSINHKEPNLKINRKLSDETEPLSLSISIPNQSPHPSSQTTQKPYKSTLAVTSTNPHAYSPLIHAPSTT